MHRTADVGVVVADAWQGLGVGSALMSALTASARARGVTSLIMDVLPGNRRMLALIARHWPAARPGYSGDFATFHITLPRRGALRGRRLHPPMRRTHRGAADAHASLTY